MQNKLRVAFPRLGRSGGPQIFLRRLRESFKKNKIAIPTTTLLPFYDVGIFSGIADNIYGKPYVVRIDGIYFGVQANDTLKKKLNEKIHTSINGAAGVIFQSAFDKLLVESYYGSVKATNVVIGNGAPVTALKEKKILRERLGFNTERLLIITVADWRRHKRLPEMVETVNRLNEINNKYDLIVVGAIKEKIATKNVHYIGRIEPINLIEYYQSADMYLHLSWLDHCPNSVVEAIANGLPVICSNKGGTRELVEGAHAGIVSECDKDVDFRECDLNNPPVPKIESIVQDIIKLFGSYDSYQKKLNRGFVDINMVAVRYAEFMDKVLQKQ